MFELVSPLSLSFVLVENGDCIYYENSFKRCIIAFAEMINLNA